MAAIFSQVVQQLQLTQEDKKIVQQITTSHSPDTSIVVNENALLTIAKEILDDTHPPAVTEHSAGSEILIHQPEHQAIPEDLTLIIHKIGCQMSCDCNEGDTKSITVAVFDLLKKYAWDTKLALAFSAFAVIYGEFSLLSQLYSTNRLAKSLVLLKPLPDISDREALIHDLLTVVMDVIKCIVELIDLPPNYISYEKPPYSEVMSNIPTAVYLTVRSIIYCASHSVSLLNVSHEYMISVSEARKKQTELITKLKAIHSSLKNQLTTCHRDIVEKKSNEVYYNIVNNFERPSTDNLVPISVILQPPEDLTSKVDFPLYKGDNKKQVGLDVLKGQMVVFFISYYDISDDEIKDIVNTVGKERQYEIVWLPIIETKIGAPEKEVILRKANMMPWYTLYPSMSLHKSVIKFIKENWHFEKKVVMVALDNQGNVVTHKDAQGKVVIQNVYHMILIWGSRAFPFTKQREDTLWRTTTLTIDYILSGIDSTVDQWIKAGKVVCFYGGDDIEWVRKFISLFSQVTKTGGIGYELIYIGKKLTETIKKENLSKYWDDVRMQKFKARLESLWYSKMKYADVKEDTLLKDLMTLLSSEGTGQGWVIMGYKSSNIVIYSAKQILESLSRIVDGKVHVSDPNFFLEKPDKGMPTKPVDRSFKHCNHIEVTATTEINPEQMICVDCHRPMQKVIVYKCCIE